MAQPAENNPTPAQVQLHEGFLVAGKYRLVAPIGEGAMGSVWSAAHTTLGHTVAMKFLHGAVANTAEPRARFEREARLAARLGEASRHITRVTDHGVTAEGTPFLVMELLQGDGLDARLKRERRLPIALIAKITSQLCRALHVAHGAGVIHRDLKPANVFLTEGEEGELLVKLLDFGVAKATLESDENQTTRAGALIGTPNYMSPEQIVGDSAVDARSDLWAVAAIVYRMAVGRAPFGSGSLSELAMRIVSTEPPLPTSLAPDLPHEFDLWVAKGLAKRPEARFQSARELADSVAMVAGVSASGTTGAFSSAAAERLALQIGDSVGGVQHTLHGAPANTLAVEPPPPRRARLFVPIAAALGLLVVAGVGLGLYAASHGGKSSAQTQSAPAAPPAATTLASNAPPPPSIASAPVVTAAPTDSVAIVAPSVSASSATVATPAANKPRPAGYGTARPKATTQTTTAPAADTATAPPAATAPPPVDPNKKADEMWKKKDEM